MNDTRETATPNPAVNGHPPVPEGEPSFLARARRILSGDIRPEDYLPVTPEVQSRVDRDMAFAAGHIRKQFEAGRIPAVFEPDASEQIRQRNGWLLSLNHGGQNVACLEDDQGVIVLAIGLEECGTLLNAFPYEQRKNVGLYTPDPPDVFWM
jgi:hypothetical protein